MKLIAQETPMGCAVACAASVANLSYRRMRRHFDNAAIKEVDSGFYNRDIILALKKVKIIAKSFSIKRWAGRRILSGSIVFVGRNASYPFGHYYVKLERGWMNPWRNFPNIHPARSGVQKSRPKNILWLIIVDR